MKLTASSAVLCIIMLFFTSCPNTVLDELSMHVVTFNSNSGSLIVKQNVFDGDVAIKPASPIRENYVFSHWYEDEDLTNIWSFDNKVHSDITLYAGWLDIPKYSVSFNTNCDTSIPLQIIKEGGYIIEPDDPKKEGFTFIGWYKEDTLENKWIFNNDKVISETTLYANWTSLPTSAVTFRTYSGNILDTVNVIQGEVVEKPTDPSRPGYNFVNWFSDSDLTFLWDFSREISSDMTLYASWKKAYYSVTFLTNSGSTISTKLLTYGVKIDKPIDPKKIGYTFLNWYSDANCTVLWDFNNGTVASDLTLYADWSPIPSYLVSFNSNGGSNVLSVSVYEGESVVKPPAPSKSDFMFYQWYKDSTLTEMWNFNNDVVVSNITLFAKYTKVGTTSESGGYIFYDDEDDYVDDLPGVRFLEIAPDNISTSMIWGKFDYSIEGADGTEIGSGKQNTDDIVIKDDTPNKAGDFCTEYSITRNGVTYDDWYLPSIDELMLIYKNLKSNNIGGIPSEWYWTSSEVSPKKASAVTFGGGNIYLNSKSVKNYVIPVRAF